MAQATYNGSYLSPEARLAIYTPTKLRNGEVNSENTPSAGVLELSA
ncbi:MAG: hypothetical protein VB957_01525 [Pseudomonadales bacterium]